MDASMTWTAVCADKGYYAGTWGPRDTFDDHYSSAEREDALSGTAEALGTECPGYSGDDFMSESLTDWPDPPEP